MLPNAWCLKFPSHCIDLINPYSPTSSDGLKNTNDYNNFQNENLEFCAKTKYKVHINWGCQL